MSAATNQHSLVDIRDLSKAGGFGVIEDHTLAMNIVGKSFTRVPAVHESVVSAPQGVAA